MLRVHKARVVHTDDGEVVRPRPQDPWVRHVLVRAAQVGDVHSTDAAHIHPRCIEPDGDPAQWVWRLRPQQLDLDRT